MAALINQVIEAGIIRYDAEGNKIVWSESGRTLAVLEKSEDANWLDQFVDWMKASKNGENIIGSFKKQLKGLSVPIEDEPEK